MLAIIGGSGLSKLPELVVTRREVVRTPYGEPSCALSFGELSGHPVVFIARHGYGHTLAPHEINYRANIWALSQQTITAIVAVSAVGAITPPLRPGDLLLPDQMIDYTYGRANTFFEGANVVVRHVDFTEPYDADVRCAVLQAAAAIGINVHDGGCYAATQGPRLETAAEINRFAKDGADVVGMTGMPEAVLARELNLKYANLAIAVNYAAGRADSRQGIDLEDAQAVMNVAMPKVYRILAEVAAKPLPSCA